MSERLSAVRIADDVRERRTSAAEIAKAVVARLEVYGRIQPQVWISRPSSDALHAAARDIDERIARGHILPLAGVPFAVKDNIDVAGQPTTAGYPALSYVPERSAFVVEKLLEAGALFVGKTNLDQFATGLVGTRTPHGAPRCVYNLNYISGGSSSGSAVATAAGLVAFAVGSDTAGSGRVPAAFNHLVGFKPSKGRWSTRGLLPACRSLDCVSVFTSDVDDTLLIDKLLCGFDAEDDYARHVADRALGTRVGVPPSAQLNWLGDSESQKLFQIAIASLRQLGYTICEVDMTAFWSAAALLYNGPWVAERAAAISQLRGNSRQPIDPVVEQIVQSGMSLSGVDVFQGQHALAHHARQAESVWSEVDLVLLPTTATIYRLREIEASPITLNANLGLYTNFVNLLDLATVAAPAGFRSNGTGFGVSLIAPAGADRSLLAIADAWMQATPIAPPLPDLETRMDRVKLAVVGAHLEGMPLHWQLTSRDAKFVGSAVTSPTYRLYSMANTSPAKPALIFDLTGQSIAVEIYELSAEAFGTFTAEVPPPLAIGTLTLSDGETVKGFVAEPRAMIGAEDITAFGGWRAYVNGQAKHAP
jgi:allophanate hydrolase